MIFLTALEYGAILILHAERETGVTGEILSLFFFSPVWKRRCNGQRFR